MEFTRRLARQTTSQIEICWFFDRIFFRSSSTAVLDRFLHLLWKKTRTQMEDNICMAFRSIHHWWYFHCWCHRWNVNNRCAMRKMPLGIEQQPIRAISKCFTIVPFARQIYTWLNAMNVLAVVGLVVDGVDVIVRNGWFDLITDCQQVFEMQKSKKNVQSLSNRVCCRWNPSKMFFWMVEQSQRADRRSCCLSSPQLKFTNWFDSNSNSKMPIHQWVYQSAAPVPDVGRLFSNRSDATEW